jgi:hypothetical protein
MKTSIETLKHIKKVDPPQDLFNKIAKRIEEQRKKTVKPLWVGIAASLLLGLFLLDIAIISKQKQHTAQNAIEQIIPQTNNTLYHE